MGRKKHVVKVLPTIWEVDDDLWKTIETVVAELDPPAETGRRRVDPRTALNGIIYQMRSGCQWNQLPRHFGDDSSVHRQLQRWVKKGIFERVWAALLECCEELGGVSWEWQSADGAMGKARFGGDMIGPNPTDRGKMGTKKV
jgi:putative transposase